MSVKGSSAKLSDRDYKKEIEQLTRRQTELFNADATEQDRISIYYQIVSVQDARRREFT